MRLTINEIEQPLFVVEIYFHSSSPLHYLPQAHFKANLAQRVADASVKAEQVATQAKADNQVCACCFLDYILFSDPWIQQFID